MCRRTGTGCRTAPAPVPAQIAPTSPISTTHVRVLSYNTEYVGYPGRVAAYGAKVREVSPAVAGLQECQDGPAMARASGLSLVPRTGNGNNMLYDPGRVRLVASGHWGITSDCYAARTVAWARYELRSGGREFWHFNTHLPHNGCAATSRNTHARIARQLLEKRAALGAGGAPAVVTGDCNPFASAGAREGSFESNLRDRGSIAKLYQGTGRHGGYGGLDKIFASAGDWATAGSGGQDHGTGSSDHPAISIDLALS